MPTYLVQFVSVEKDTVTDDFRSLAELKKTLPKIADSDIYRVYRLVFEP